MILPARGFLVCLLAFGALVWGNGAQAGSRPAEACRPMAHLPGELWLGHFTGGKRIAGGVDWRDEYVCFTNRPACRAWWISLNRVYRDYHGYGTCLALRGGGRVVVAKPVRHKVAHRTVVRARY